MLMRCKKELTSFRALPLQFFSSGVAGIFLALDFRKSGIYFLLGSLERCVIGEQLVNGIEMNITREVP